MNDYSVIIMSIDPDDPEGAAQGDNHQKYSIAVEESNEEKAAQAGIRLFKLRHPSLPVYSARAVKK